jgi:hypothetical protein
LSYLPEDQAKIVPTARERILGSIESCPAEDRYKANFPFNALGIGTR